MVKKKKYIIRLYSGTGNELFIYAFYRYLILKFNLNVYLDTKSGIIQKYGTNPEGTLISLNKLNTKYKIANDKFCFLGFLGKLTRFYYKFISKTDFYITEKLFNINIEQIVNSKNSFNYIEGYFQDLKFIKPIKRFLIKEIVPKKKSAYFERLKKKINFNNSICICYRDFGTTDSNIFKKIDKVLNLPSSKNKDIYIFSNNTKKLLKKSKNLLKTNFQEVKFNYHKQSIYALDLMSNFRIFVIGSSTFHWWGAFLSKKNKKIYLTNKIHKSLKLNNMKII